MQNSHGSWPLAPLQQPGPNEPPLHHPPQHSSPFQPQAQLHPRPQLQPPLSQPPQISHHPGPFMQQSPQMNIHAPQMQAPLKGVGQSGSPNVPSHSQYIPTGGRLQPPLPQGVKAERDFGQVSAVPEVLVSDSRTSSEKQRIRVNRACDRCRLHKIKCTGLHPCVNCSKQGIECVIKTGKLQPESSAPKKRRTDDDDSTSPTQLKSETSMDDNSGATENTLSKSDSSTSDSHEGNGSRYTTYLENRVQYLEHLLARRTAGLEISGYPEDRRLKDVMDILTPTSTKWKVSRRVHSALAIQLCSDLYESLPPEARDGLSVPRTNHYGWNMSGCNYIKLEVLPPIPDIELSIESQTDYLDFFFREVNPIYAMLHESVFREQFEAFQKVQTDDAASNTTALFRAMIFLVLAISIRFKEFMKPNGPSMEMLSLEEELFKYSYRTVVLFTQEWESFELIQCWLLTTLYLRITHRQTSCFFSLGNAVNMCRGMGLGKYESIVPDIKPYTKLKAEKIFFSVYIFDRVIGLQGGRFRSLDDSDVTREFPSLDDISGACNDGWSTLPALAMVHIARLSNFMEIFISNDDDRSKAELIEKEFSVLNAFLERAGFNDLDSSKMHLENLPMVSPMVKAQVRLHYCELVTSVHGKGLFSYFGQNVSIEGMDLGRVFEANKKTIAIFKKLEELNYLNAPWYLTLTSLLTVGITSLVFMHVRSNLRESKLLLNESITFLKKLQNSPVRDERGKLVFRHRFKMVEECIWLIKMINHLMILSFEQSIKSLAELGTDHGSSAVNKRLFSQFGWEGSKPGGLDQLMNQRSRSEGEIRDENWPNYTKLVMDSSPESCVSQPKSNTVAAEEFLENFAWFEQWMDSAPDL